MDYETIVYGTNSSTTCRNCYIDSPEVLGWDRGEVTEIELPIYGGFTLSDGTFISISDFMKDSYTKLVRMTLKDYLGETVDSQEVLANSADIEYREDSISCFYVVDRELSDSLHPGSYTLYVQIEDIIPIPNSKITEKTVFSKMVTRPEGLEIIIS